MYGLARPFLFGLDPERAHALGLVVLMFASTAAWAETPATFMGKPVKEVPWYILDHEPITLHATDSGFIPEESGHLRFVYAGPLMHRPSPGGKANFEWEYSLEILDGAKPRHVLIEDVSGDDAVIVIDDDSPLLSTETPSTWHGKQASKCVIDRSNDCAAWVFGSGLQVVVFRATVTFDDGTVQTLYQGTGFYPDRMKAVWKAFDVKR